MKSVIIIDDEEDARVLLLQYLRAYPDYEVIGQAEDGRAAVSLINALRPDLIFLDIQMPGFNGFEVLVRLEELPQVVFSTAFDQYALKAFEVHALDYLLKPYGKKRFENTMLRLQTMTEKLLPLAEKLLAQEEKFPNKVILQKGNRSLLIEVAVITYIEAFGDYSKVYLENGDKLLSTNGISTLQEKLNPKNFKRIHRSYLINFSWVTALRKVGRYYYLVLTNKQQLKVSESYLSEIRKFLL
ncbi:MAG: LytR/AlgR family response regulator transcription factor [Saprospiraceae bacterium]